MAIPYSSDGKPLSEKDYYLIRLAALTPFTPSEPSSISEARNRIDTAVIALEYLRAQGLPPIFSSFEYQGLVLRRII
jgi:hypothetical protein